MSDQINFEEYSLQELLKMKKGADADVRETCSKHIEERINTVINELQFIRSNNIFHIANVSVQYEDSIDPADLSDLTNQLNSFQEDVDQKIVQLHDAIKNIKKKDELVRPYEYSLIQKELLGSLKTVTDFCDAFVKKYPDESNPIMALLRGLILCVSMLSILIFDAVIGLFGVVLISDSVATAAYKHACTNIKNTMNLFMASKDEDLGHKLISAEADAIDAAIKLDTTREETSQSLKERIEKNRKDPHESTEQTKHEVVEATLNELVNSVIESSAEVDYSNMQLVVYGSPSSLTVGEALNELPDSDPVYMWMKELEMGNQFNRSLLKDFGMSAGKITFFSDSEHQPLKNDKGDKNHIDASDKLVIKNDQQEKKSVFYYQVLKAVLIGSLAVMTYYRADFPSMTHGKGM